MKTNATPLPLFLAASLLAAEAIAAENPPSVAAPARPAAAETFTYEQKPFLMAPLPIPFEQAREIVERFRAAYPKLENPRVLVFVNRDLVDEDSGMKLAGRAERTASVRGSGKDEFNADPKALLGTNVPGGHVTIKAGGDVTVGGLNTAAAQRQPGKGSASHQGDAQVNENTYRFREKNRLSLADKQDERQIEMAFSRPLRAAGATVVDQRVATALIADRPLKSFTIPTEGEQARKDRNAIAKIADVVLEVLISQRTVVSREVSGDRPRPIYVVTATAIRLKDSSVLGQSTSDDLLGPQRRIETNRLYLNYAPPQIAEATALLLMDNMTASAQR